MPVCAAIARFELWVPFPSCTARDAKFVMSFSGMLQEHSVCLLMFLLYFDSFFLSQKFFTTKPHITKMLSGIIVLCMAKKGNTAGSERYFQMFTRDMVKYLLAGLTGPVILSDCCHTTCFSPEYFTPMLQFILTSRVLRTTSAAGPFSLWCLCWDNH